MFVCVCKAVTEAEVGAAIDGGCHTRSAVTRACGAGADCGSCHGMIDHMIEERLDSGGESGPQVIPAAALVRTTRAA